MLAPLMSRSAPSGCRMSDAALQKQPHEARNGQGSDEVWRSAVPSRPAGATFTRPLVASDTLALVLALLVAYVITSSMPLRAALEPGGLVLVTATLPAWLAGARLSGLYSRNGQPIMNAMARERVSLGHLVLIGTALCLLVALATQSDDGAREGLLIFAVSAVVFLTAGRVVARALARRSESAAQTALIVGAGDVGQLVAQKAASSPGVRDQAGRVRGRAAKAVAGRRRRRAGPRRDRRFARDRSRARRGPRNRGVLEMHRPRHAGVGTPARAPRRARRRRHTDVRAGRSPRWAGGRRGNPTRQHLAAHSLSHGVASEARDRCRRSERRVDLRGAAVPLGGVADPTGVARAGVLPSDPPRGGHAGVHDVEVPHDDGSTRISPRIVPTSPRP